MWLSERDKEVECFHPVCADALEKALDRLGMSETYFVEHHRYVGNLEMDLVISNKSTNKILCVVEVKRTIPAVYSTRYQYQAMSYVQELRDVEKETNYYILTNLECSCMFLYSNQKPNVYDQLLEPGFIFNHRFEDVSEQQFKEDLSNHFCELINKINGRYTEYVLSFSQFTSYIQHYMPHIRKWNSSLVFLFYEYIRGAFNAFGRDGLLDIKYYRNDIFAICREALSYGFEGIFGKQKTDYDINHIPNSSLISQLYKLGQNYRTADAICNIMHQVISKDHVHEGEVPTDIELAQTLVTLVKTFIPNLQENENISDPAAGSGTLVSAAIQGYSEINPRQIRVNDINVKLLQLLTLRLGLSFPTIVSKNNFPVVSCLDIADLEKDFFKGTRIIVLNPPYVSAVSEANNINNRKNKFATRIRNLTGHVSKNNIGQAPLENLFLELVNCLVDEGTIIACIIPNTHLTALGQAEVTFRKFLLEDFGLSLIFKYPQTSLFDDVNQNTSIFIGKSKHPQNEIKFIQSISFVSEINLEDLASSINLLQASNKPIEITNGIEGYLVNHSTLENSVEQGWSFLDSINAIVIDFLETKIKSSSIISEIGDSGFSNIYRGRVGNSGGSDLLFVSSNKNFFNEVEEDVLLDLAAGMRNAEYPNFRVGNGDNFFFDVSLADDQTIETVVSLYNDKYTKKGKQVRKEKSTSEWIEILKSESRNFVPSNTVLLPRGTRKVASTYVTTKRTFISTNFIAIETSSYQQAYILGSWMSSIFYQLQLEQCCKNQAGMRKLEIANINNTFVPNFSKLSLEDKQFICETEIDSFINLREPSPRKIDIAWALVITRKDKQQAEELIEKTIKYLTILAKNREN